VVDRQLQLFSDNLPDKPYCTDVLGHRLNIFPALNAIKRRYIQPNSPYDLRWLVYDIDRPSARYDWDDLRAPAPNILAANPENGHAHLLYGLEVPVYKQPEAHHKPLRYVAAIDVALTEKLQADPSYAGLLCKNPLHPHWNVTIYEKESYDLAWLADYVDLEPYRDKRKHLPPIGLGRNCTLFEVSRRWAYSKIRSYEGNASGFIDLVTGYSRKYNCDRFPVPLPDTEVRATGKSIGKWTYKNMSPQGFRAWGDSRREKSIQVRRVQSAERAAQAKILEAAGKKQIEIARILGISDRQVRTFLKTGSL
jgi:hypothetical protein